jgi:MazG family protein
MSGHPELERCIQVVKALRHPEKGCPWDLEQTHQSLLKYLIEEAYEFVDAVEVRDTALMEEEIGDVLFQVLLHTSMGEETGAFSLESAARVLADKLVRRHPHVFGVSDDKLTSEEVVANWQKIKLREKGEKKYEIDEKFLQAPALESAYKIGKKSTSVNFDWTNFREVALKVEEEWLEVKGELEAKQLDHVKIKEEIGDLLFSVAQLARHLELNPEQCLREANRKFIRRFNKVEDLVRDSGATLAETSRPKLEEFWVQVKKL